jgi:3'(2'), 5'-bisphosphate nucleotidase
MEFSGLLFIAARGLGSWWTPLEDVDDWRRLHVSKRTLKEAVRLKAPNRDQKDQSTPDIAVRSRLSEELKTTHEIRSSTTVRYPLLATGQGDLYIRLVLAGRMNQELYPWDHAAGSLLVEEAGGRVTDLDGKPLDFTAGRVLNRNRGLVASNGVVHDEALAAIHLALTASDS